jgi:hypothetical protein
VTRSGVWTLLVLAVAVSACGESAAPPPAQPRLTQAAFVRKAKAICRRWTRTTKGLDARLKKASKRRDLEALDLAIGEARRPLRSFVFQLSHLRPPLRQERRFRQFIHLLNQELVLINSVYIALGTYDVQALRALDKRGTRLDRRVNAFSRPLGLRHCGD